MPPRGDDGHKKTRAEKDPPPLPRANLIPPRILYHGKQLVVGSAVLLAALPNLNLRGQKKNELTSSLTKNGGGGGGNATGGGGGQIYRILRHNNAYHFSTFQNGEKMRERQV